MHIFDIWENDLDRFLEALDTQEAIEEKDRMAHPNSNGGANKKKGPRKAAAKNQKALPVKEKTKDAGKTKAFKKPEPRQ